MKNIINKLNLNCKQFSELYEIPYMTVNQWYNGKRTPPKWVVKLFNELIESKKKGEQISIEKDKKYYLHYLNNDLCYIYTDVETAQKWQNFSKNITKARLTEIREITIKEEKTIMIAENLTP